MYSSKDVSIIIVTYNRSEELYKNLEHLSKLTSKPREVIIVDESLNNLTEKVCKKFKQKVKGLRYIRPRSNIPSIARSKNAGVRNTSKHTSIVLFLDDDAYVGKDYLDEIIKAYNSLEDAKGIFGEESVFSLPKKQSLREKIKFYVEKSAKKLFLLGFRGDKSYRMTSPYGNTFANSIHGPLPAQWFSGTDPSYKKEVFNNLAFDEKFFGWSLGEDVDISYRIYKTCGNLYVVPSSLVHSNPKREDTPERKIKRIYMNQINHFYLFYKDMPEMKLKFAWNLIGIFFLRFFSLLDFPHLKEKEIEFEYFVKSLVYCLRNTKKIRKGDITLPIK